MKFFKLLHIALSIIPFAWLCSLLLILVIGVFHFGYIPKYGNPIDPYALGLDWIYFFEVWLALLSFLSFFTWPLLTVMMYLLFKDKFAWNKLSIVFFITGIVGFFIFKYGFPETFLWVVD
jgi:hypothetical protein